jgi:microcystin-dependent protein
MSLFTGRKGKNKSGLFDQTTTGETHTDHHVSGGSTNQLVPPGSVVMWASTKASIPDGWLRCDGAAVSRDEYQALFEAIGTTFGAGDGSTTFNLPDARDRFVIGTGTSVSIAGTGGSFNHDHGGGTYATNSSGTHPHDAINNSSGSAGSHSHSSAGSHSHSNGTLDTSADLNTTTLQGTGTGSLEKSLLTHTHAVTGSTASGGSHGHGADGSHTHGGGSYVAGTAGSSHSHGSITGSSGTANPPYIGLNLIIKT